MSDPQVCPVCGASLPSDAPAGACPRCSFRGALKDGQDDSSAVPERPNPSPLGCLPGDSITLESKARHFGDYELLEEIARGGMGVVYKARQVSLDRLVAVKLLLAGSMASPAYVKRFRTEASAAASLQHPNIVAIHEVGVHQGQHDLVMDYVDGPSLAKIIADTGARTPDFRRSVQWMKNAAEAVHYAHEHGILHRDLKPSNILIDATDQPRVTDFGLAKRFEGDSELSLSGQVVGSPGYIPPEQAAARRGKVSRRSDVYGLGATLYHLLTGRAPFQAATLTDTLNEVLNTDPVAPRVLNPSVPADLETVCLKCLEKEPAQRYGTALELAEELTRYLEGKPVLARPVNRPAKLWRWCHRQPVRATLVGALIVTIILGLTGVILEWRRAERQRLEASANALLAEQNAYAADMSLAQRALEANDLGLATGLLERYRPTNTAGFPVHSGRTTDLRHWEWRYLRQRCMSDEWFTLCQYPTWVTWLQISSDGQVLAFRKADGQAAVWDLAARQRLIEVPASASTRARNLAFAPGSHLLAVANLSATGEARLSFLDIDTRKEGLPMPLATAAQALAYSGDGSLLGILHNQGHQEEVTVQEVGSKRICARFGPWARPLGKTDSGGLCFSSDGSRLVIGHADAHIRIVDWRTGAQLEVPSPDKGSGIIALACSPTEDLVAWGSGSGGSLIWLWNWGTQEPISELKGHTDWIVALAFSPNGRLLASASADRSIRLWNVADRTEFRRFQGHLDEVWGLAFLPDGQTLVSGGKDGSVRFWRINNPNRHPTHETLPTPVSGPALAFAADGQSFVTACQDGSIRRWSTRPLQELERLRPPGSDVCGLDLSPNGRWLALADASGSIQILDWRTQQAVTNFPTSPAAVVILRFSPGAKFLLQRAISTNGSLTAHLWETATWNRLAAGEVDAAGSRTMSISPDERVWAAGYDNGAVKLRSLPANRQLGTLTGHVDAVEALAFSPDGRMLATASDDGYVILWDLPTQRQLRRFRAHFNTALGVAFSSDARRLATLGTFKDPVKLWDLTTFRELVTLPAKGPWFYHLAFSPDGETLVAIGTGGITDFWYAPPFAELEAEGEAKAHP